MCGGGRQGAKYEKTAKKRHSEGSPLLKIIPRSSDDGLSWIAHIGFIPRLV